MEFLTKIEAEDRLRFIPEDARFCPDCLTELKLVHTDDSIYYCPNEMCLNDEQGELNE